jgi:glycosyltransferase involved in cell wall biosynthesis
MGNTKVLNLCVVSNLLNHGHTYDEWSTSFVIAMSKIEEVDKITVYCPPSNGGIEIDLPEKCRIEPVMDYARPFSIISLSKKIAKGNFDGVIIISGPTAFGNGILSNLFGIMLPLRIMRRGQRNVKIINQGSTLTHDVYSLGYRGIINSIKLYAVRTLEKHVYKRVRTYFQLRYYCDVVENNYGRKYVAGIFPSDFIDALATLYLNGKENEKEIKRNRNRNQTRVLLHGFWGPQKDPETALKAVRKLKMKYPDIHLTISGGINNHFPEYREYFYGLLKNYADVIDANLGYVEEKNLLQLFMENEIVLMPYIASGGQSGVLEMASFFENIVVCSDFPEFREEQKSELVILTCLDDFEQSLFKAFEIMNKIPNIINVQNKIQTVIDNIRIFLAD